MHVNFWLAALPVAIIAAILVYGLRRRLRKRRSQDSSEVDRHQLELNSYIQNLKNGREIGLFYERQIGYILESEGYDVTYNGALKGVADLGIDLIAYKDKQIFVIQAKCWSRSKVIDEEYILRLIESAFHYKTEKGYRYVIPVFYSTTEFNPRAREIADLRNMKLHVLPLDKNYPMIKCNVNKLGERIFHLPSDYYYDKIKIRRDKGAFYAKTVAEAVDHGFRRAKKYRGTQSA